MYVNCQWYIWYVLHVFACGPKTVLVKRTFLGRGGAGWGGHVNVPCTSYIIVCYAAQISGIVATLLATTLQRSLVLLLRDMILRCWWGGVGWGPCQRFLYFVHNSVPRCKDLWDRCYVTCYYAATTLLRSLGSLLRYLLLRCYYDAEISGIVAACYYAAEISGIVATLYLLLLPADNGACVAAMTVKSQKTCLKFFQVFKSSNQHGTVVKSPFLDTMCTPMSTVSGPAGCFSMYTHVLFWWNGTPQPTWHRQQEAWLGDCFCWASEWCTDVHSIFWLPGS